MPSLLLLIFIFTRLTQESGFILLPSSLVFRHLALKFKCLISTCLFPLIFCWALTWLSLDPFLLRVIVYHKIILRCRVCAKPIEKIQSVLLNEIRFRNPLDGGQVDSTIVKKWPMNLERFSYIEFWKAVNLWQLNFYLLWIFLKKKNNKFTKAKCYGRNHTSLKSESRMHRRKYL